MHVINVCVIILLGAPTILCICSGTNLLPFVILPTFATNKSAYCTNQMYPLKSYVLPPVGVRLMDQGSCTVSTQLKAVHTQVVTTHTTKVMRPQMSFLHLETMQSSLKCFIGSENFKASQFLLSSPLSVSDPGHFLPNSATSSLSEGKKSCGRAVRWQNHCVPGFEEKNHHCVSGFEESHSRCGTCSCGRMCMSGRAWVVLEGSVVVRWVYKNLSHMKWEFGQP